MDDAQLLRDYVLSRSTDALATLIERHIDFVHASALRQVRDPELAEDVTQAVFIILARKADSIRPASLAGWLFNTTHHCAANARRAERRRRHHERHAAKPEVQMRAEDSTVPVLDDAMAGLAHSDREIVILRYMRQCEFSEVSEILGISEPAARRRLSRAVERLRHLLSRGSAALPAAQVLHVLSTAAPKAPAHLLTSTIQSATLGTSAAVPASALASRTIRVMTLVKLKTAAVILLGAAVAAASSVAIVKAMNPQAAGPQIADAAPPAPAQPADAAPAANGPLQANFPDGSRVELIGVALSPVDGRDWWRPDGSPLAQAPYPHSSGFVSASGKTPYEFALRLIGLKADSAASASVPGSAATSKSNPRPDILATVDAIDPGPSTNVDFVAATGPWQIRIAVPASTVFASGVTVGGVSFASGADSKNASIRVTASPGSLNSVTNDDLRIFAIDFNGIEHNPTQWSSNEGPTGETMDLGFSNLRRDQIREFRICTRVYNRSAEFQNVSLVPGQLTVPKVQIHDSGAFVANFSAGGSAEVVGITDWPPTGKWWQPDGSPIDQPLAVTGQFFGPDPKPDERAYIIATRYAQPHGKDSFWSWNDPKALAIGVNDGANAAAASPDFYRVTLPAGSATTELRFGLAASDWHKWPSVIPGDAPASVQVDKTQISFSRPDEKDGDVLITTVDNLRTDAKHDVQRRLIATDTAGNQHVAHIESSKQAAGQYTFRIPQMTKAQIKSYELQTLPYEYVDFKNLALRPNQHTDVTIQTDNPPIPVAAQPGDEGI